MIRLLAFLYSLAAYACFGLCLLYLLAFLAGVPGVTPRPAEGPAGPALLINFLLLAGFALQHSVMARPGFKRRWTSIVPAPIERSTYVLVSSAVTFVLCYAWQPLPGVLWSAESVAAQGLWWAGFALGLAVLLGASFHIDHFELLGLRQTWLALPERDGNPATSASLAEWLTRDRVIRQYALHGAGHVVPQREAVLPPLVGAPAGDIDFGEAVLEFVASWPEPPGTASPTANPRQKP
jgi:protein-S-isoprenylcysteine O-methyltransferase Ste14